MYSPASGEAPYRVAVKRLKGSLNDEEDYDSFYAEVELMKRLNHRCDGCLASMWHLHHVRLALKHAASPVGACCVC